MERARTTRVVSNCRSASYHVFTLTPTGAEVIYRVTFGFSGNGTGWSETHAVRGNSDNPVDIAPACILVAQKRVTFLAREYVINAIRISRYSDNGALTRARGVYPISQQFANPVQTAIQAGEPKDVAYLARGSTSAALAPAGFEANINQTFLGGPADDAVNNAGVVDPGKSGLGAGFAQWRSAMLANSFGWLVSKTIADREISTITQLGDGRVELVTLGNISPPLVLNSIYTARIRRVNGGVSPLNGQVIVRCTAVGTLVTQEVIGLGLAQAGGSIRIYQPISPFVAFNDIVLNGFVGEHKRGRPFGSTPGRARRRVRG